MSLSAFTANEYKGPGTAANMAALSLINPKSNSVLPLISRGREIYVNSMLVLENAVIQANPFSYTAKIALRPQPRPVISAKPNLLCNIS